MNGAQGGLEPPAAATEARADLGPAVDLLHGRWVLAILDQLDGGPRRHSDLKVALAGISEKVLTESLRRMERDGLVRREPHPDGYNRVVYASTALAHSLDPMLRATRRWQQRQWPRVVQARQGWDGQRL